MKGILLMCFNSQTYGKFAYNMAHSIRYYTDLPIHLLCDRESIEGIDTSVFSSYEIIDFERNEFGRIDNCLAKISLYERSPFDETLYLDVDGIMINNPEDIFKQLEGEIIWTQPMGKGTKTENITYTWADNEIVWSRYNLPEETVFNTTQTSIIYFTKDAKLFFDVLKENYGNKLNKQEYREMWGRSSQHPDELYYSVTLAQMGIDLKEFRPVFFPEKIETVTNILNKYYVLSMYGGNNVKPYAKSLYDRVMQSLLNKIGRNHYYKVEKLYKNKFINIK